MTRLDDFLQYILLFLLRVTTGGELSTRVLPPLLPSSHTNSWLVLPCYTGSLPAKVFRGHMQLSNYLLVPIHVYSLFPAITNLCLIFYWLDFLLVVRFFVSNSTHCLCDTLLGFSSWLSISVSFLLVFSKVSISSVLVLVMCPCPHIKTVSLIFLM